MNLDILKEKGNPFEIDCSRRELPELFKQLGFRKGVEIGVQKGNHLKLYCDMGFRMWGVDPYKDDFKPKLDVGHEKNFQIASEMVSHYPNATLIRKKSMDAVHDFGKRSLDFVYIDGLHDFLNVALDLHYWTDKVRGGGIIAGHDYNSDAGKETRHHRAVGPVVRAFCESKDIYNWYTMGRGFGENMSFMFVKHW